MLAPRIFAAIAAVGLVIGAAACGSTTSNERSAPITAAEFGTERGEEWPLIVDSGTVTCMPVTYTTDNGRGSTVSSEAVFFIAPDGTRYAANGNAKDYGPALPELDEITRIDPMFEALPDDENGMSTIPVIARGLELCSP